MSNKFQTKGHEASERPPSKWIEAPCAILADLVVCQFHRSSRKGTPGIEMIHVGEPVKGLSHEYGSGRMAKTYLWLSEKAFPRTLDVITLMADRLGKRDELNEATGKANNEEEFAKAVQSVFEGIRAAWLFSAEEVWIENEDGTYNDSPWIKPTMNTLGSFVRPADALDELKQRLDTAGEDRFIKKNPRPAAPQQTYRSEGGADW